MVLLPLFLFGDPQSRPYKINNFTKSSRVDDIMLCANLNRYFINSSNKLIKEHIKVVPNTEFGVNASYETICIQGLQPRKRYSVTFDKNLPLGKQHLDKEYTFTKETGDYLPSFRFKESGYILPAKGEITLPLESRNIQKVAVNLYRINQNNLMQAMNQYSLRETLARYELKDIQNESGYLLWQKRLSINSLLNKKVVTAVPIGRALKTRKPGVYIAAVASIDKDGEPNWYSAQTAWFMVSDIGIFTIKGKESLHIYTKHLSDATTYSGVKLELISRNNELLAKTESKNGYAEFKSALLNGKDALAAKAIYAYGKRGDFTVLDLSRPKLDLSDRGDSGRMAAESFDAFIYSNRGIFKPKESIKFHAIVRDSLAKVAKGITLSAKLHDSQEKTVAQKRLHTDPLGHVEGEFKLPNKTGRYSILLYAGGNESIGKRSFLVEDFIPPKVELSISQKPQLLKPFQAEKITFFAKYLTGEPLVKPQVDYTITLKSSQRVFKEYKGYHFGKVGKEHFSRYIYGASKVGERNGSVSIPLIIDQVADTTLPLIASVKVYLLEPGGRGIERYFALPYLNQEGYIGIKPKFKNSAIDLNAEAAFDIIYLKNLKAASTKVHWRVVREEPHWNWRSSGESGWEYYITYEDIKTVKEGDLNIKSTATQLKLAKLNWGSYRLELSTQNGALSSYRFSSGYEQSSSKASPDRLPVRLNKQEFAPQESVTAEIKAKFTGPMLVQIASNRLLATKKVEAVANKPVTVSFKIKKEWGSSLYLLATAFRQQSSKLGATRAVGLAHIRVIDPKNRVDIAIKHPQKVRSQSLLALQLSSKSAKSQKINVTVAAVDKGVLNLTRYKLPDPYNYFFGQRRLGVALHDVYSELIKTSGAHAEFDVGSGDMEEDSNNPAAVNKRRVVALLSKTLTFNKEGKAKLNFKIPDYQGALELMAVAWGKEGVGSANAEVIVKDPVVTELYLPRFLALNDSATILAEVRFAKELPDGSYKLKLKSNSALQISPKEFSLELGATRVFRKAVNIEAKAPGDANITLEVYKEGKMLGSRNFALATRVPYIKSNARVAGILDGNVVFNSKTAINSNKWMHINNLTLTVSSAPLLAVGSLKQSLIDYCCRCAEQTTSRGYAFLNDPKQKELVNGAIERLYELQKFDGGFGLWEGSEASQWVSSYVLDFLSRAKDAGFRVSQKRIESGLRYLQQHLSRWSKEPGKVEADAYALYVLARNKHILVAEIMYHANNTNSPIKASGGWAHLAAALNLIGEKERAKALFAKAKSTLYANGDYYSNYGGALRDKAVLIVLESEAGFKDLAQPLFIDLALDSKDRKYLSTQEMSMLIRAQKSVDIPSSRMHIKVGVEEFNGKRFSRLYGSISKLPEVHNLSSNPLWYTLHFTATPNPESYSSSDNSGFSIEKHLYTLSGKAVDLKNIKQSERIVVEINGTIEDKAIKHPLILDLLPSGFEIENPNISSTDGTQGLRWLGRKSTTQKQIYRDDRYIAALEPGTHGVFKVAYIARAVTKGKFAFAPTLIEDMYKPYYRALTTKQAWSVTIKDASEIVQTVTQNSSNQESNVSNALSSSEYKKAFTTVLKNLKQYSTLELYYLRNGIFAQAGLNFATKNPSLHKIFSQFEWYKPNKESGSVVYNSLTALQKENIQALLKEEKRRLGGLVFADFYRVRIKALTPEYLSRYSKKELRLLRNSLIARYGYAFKDKKLRSIFENLPWYKPDPKITTSEAIDTLMSQLERANLQTILQVEKSSK